MSDAKIIARSLLKQAEQIAEAGHAGWGNLDRDAADLIEQQATCITALESDNKALGEFVVAVGGFWGDSKSLLTGEFSLAANINAAFEELEHSSARIAQLEAQIASLSKSATAPTPSAIEATAALIANGLVGQASEEDVREVERLINELLRGK